MERTDTAIRNRLSNGAPGSPEAHLLTSGTPFVHRRTMSADTPFLTYGQVETLLGAMLDIHATQEGKLVGRFKLLRRLGFPEGVNVLRGRFDYDLQATMKCLLAFVLADGLLPLPHASALIARIWNEIWPDIGAIVRDLDFSKGRLDLGNRPDRAMLLVVEAGGLRYLSRPAASHADAQHDIPQASETAALLRPDELGSQIAAPPSKGIPSARIVFDLHGIVAWAADAITSAGWMTAEQLKAATRAR